LIYDPREWQIDEKEAISEMKTDELDRLVVAGKIRAIDREQVRFIVRRIVQPLLDPTSVSKVLRLLARWAYRPTSIGMPSQV
jgi:hypothetical protein